MPSFKDKLKSFLLYAALFLGAIGNCQAESFTSKEFLELPEASQKFWIQGAMLAMGQVAARKNKEQGKCIIDWYFGDDKAQRNGLILGSMKKYPNYAPSVIFVFLTEQACGAYYN